MGVSAIIEDGLVSNAVSATSEASEKGKTSLGKDDFLQLLVAQMKYQDPLEPTSNTEYIAQYATFSEVEQMQNMSQSMDLSRASGLVGKTVEVTTTSESGVESTIMGKVDYVKYENGKALVAIDESLYSLDDVTYVCDEAYLTAYGLASNLVSDISKLPEVEKITLSDKNAITEILETYDGMDDYQKTFVANEVKQKIEQYREKLTQVVKAAENSADNNNSNE
ncbi:MAG: flagellar hook capping protein [Lachnospiraceae bacterium]|nr:flagellar hook capping protein [Lachnospiraceae bacterium]